MRLNFILSKALRKYYSNIQLFYVKVHKPTRPATSLSVPSLEIIFFEVVIWWEHVPVIYLVSCKYSTPFILSAEKSKTFAALVRLWNIQFHWVHQEVAVALMIISKGGEYSSSQSSEPKLLWAEFGLAGVLCRGGLALLGFLGHRWYPIPEPAFSNMYGILVVR